MEDWFSTNAPKPVTPPVEPTNSTATDWFTANAPKPATATVAAPPVTPTLPATPKPYTYRDAIESGINEAGDSLVHLPGQIYHAFVDKPTPSETSLTITSSPINRAAQRLIVQPSIDNIKDFLTKFKDDPYGLKPESHISLLKAIPLLGPTFAPLGAALEHGDYKEATKQASNLLTQGMVANIGEASGELLGGAKKTANSLIERSANKAADLAALKASNPAMYTQSIEPMAEAFSVKSGESRFADFADTADTAMSEIKKSADQIFKGPITSNRMQIEAGKDAMNRIYTTEIGPKVGLVESVDLRPLAEKLKSEIPNSFSDVEKRAIARYYDDQLNKTVSGPEAEKLRQKFSAASRVNLALNNYERAAVEKLPTGYRLNALNNGMRDLIANEVDKVQPGTDIRPALDRYGKVTDLIQQAGGIPVDKTTMELLTGKAYITGTTPNITGRAVEALTKKWYANDNLIRRAYEKYQGPVQQPVVAKTGVNTLRGEQNDLLPNTGGMRDPGVTPPNNVDLGSTHGNVGLDTQGDLFAQPQLKSPIIAQSPVPRSGPLSLPEITSSTPTSYKFERVNPTMPMPEVTSSFRLNTKALYGKPELKSLPPAPFKFELRGQPPLEIKVGTATDIHPNTIQSTTDTTGSMANRYPPNWQVDSTARNVQTIDGHQQTVNAGGPGTLITTDPKVVENTIAKYDELIQKTKVKTKLAELQFQRDSLVKQLIEYNKQLKAGVTK